MLTYTKSLKSVNAYQKRFWRVSEVYNILLYFYCANVVSRFFQRFHNHRIDRGLCVFGMCVTAGWYYTILNNSLSPDATLATV